MKQLLEKEIVQYLIAGITTIAILSVLIYIAPIFVLGACFIALFLLMSLAVGYILVDSYKNWKSWDK